MAKPLIMHVMQPIWRLRRGMTLGVQALVQDADGQVLLVRHGYRSGWHFPGGGVEHGETVYDAITRELAEETGIVPVDPPTILGIFANIKLFPGDHIALFQVVRWRRPQIPAANAEIRESRFFPLAQLPDDLAPGAQRRLVERQHGVTATSAMW